jgi:hypothetical protein
MRWLFGSPFRDLPEGFGKPLPEIRAFEEEMEMTQHLARGKVPVATERHHRYSE